jgi:Fic family protein
MESRQMHPLLVTAIFIVVFLEIHPFQDGNGRLSRLLTTLLLLRAGYSYVPYSSLESVIDHSKEGDYLTLRQTQETLASNNPIETLAESRRHAQKIISADGGCVVSGTYADHS